MEQQPSQTFIGRIIAVMMISFGILALAISYLLLTNPYTFTNSVSDQEFSTVPVTVNYPAPELNFTTLNGDPASLHDYKGQVILINLWATWCPPCMEEIPTLQTFYEKYKKYGFVLLAIDQGETADKVQPFVLDLGLSFPIWLDPSSEAGRIFKTMSLPSSFVVDRNGQVRLMWIGGISKKNLEKYVPDIILE